MILDHNGTGTGRRAVEYLQPQKLRRASSVGMIALSGEGMERPSHKHIGMSRRYFLPCRLKEIKNKLVGGLESQTGDGQG